MSRDADGSPSADPADEFAWLPENAAEAGVPPERLLPVRRTGAGTAHGRLSALRWGDGPQEVVLLHGGGQNAHTWDTVLAGLGAPALAVDLPGHPAIRPEPGTDDDAPMNITSQEAAYVPLVGRIAAGGPILAEEAVEDRSPERVLLGKQTLADVLRTLDNLGEKTRDIYILFRLENMKQREIAALLGIGQSTVEKHVIKATLHLARVYGER